VTDCISGRLYFPACRGPLVEAGFGGDAVTSDGGVLLLARPATAGLTIRVSAAGGATG